MKNAITTLVLSLIIISALVLANQEISKQPAATLPPTTKTKAILAKWEATPDGIQFISWKSSAEGRKVLASAAKVKNHISDSSLMEAIITSLTLPTGSRLGYGVMVRINEEEYILSFGPLKYDEFQQLESLKINDRIMIRSHMVSYAPKYAYPIVSGNYVERESKLIYKAPPRKGGC